MYPQAFLKFAGDKQNAASRTDYYRKSSKKDPESVEERLEAERRHIASWKAMYSR